MFSPEIFFNDEDWEDQELFQGIGQIWEVLPRIKDYIRSKKSSNLQGLFPTVYFFPCLTVLFQGEALTDGLTLIPGDATKGELRVFYKNQELREATVFFGGATLSGDDIFIGEGSVVETGAFIQGPAYIGKKTEVRQGAYLRGGCLV
jgi:UDP-N-acetylglucosamine diphosphorylase / glucose-1-phosphate thymidylyltransferase / UDP-N-acetylgalactosamine diphosphorylase / glucosamine-1-phosphate N-acetyltransferase / galactosamine-1-phosphate N-acetyltransferase